jgi:hypothetical protein
LHVDITERLFFEALIIRIGKGLPPTPTLLLRSWFSSSYSGKELFTMLYLIGLGLADEKDITVKGLEIVRKVERVYLEAYTSILLVDYEKLVWPSFPRPPNSPKT